ncbi:MAG: hypothetical protein E7607_05590 [Ruminococcaceae bacterium]|nr:hypothetical protein [Oscillospiraceae bacterium]
MEFEKYTQIFNEEPKGATVRPKGKAFELSFDLDRKADKNYRLFTVGETEQYYLWKDEPDTPRLYHMLTDALDTKHAIRDRYCLSLTCKKYEDYLKRIYKKVMWKPVLSYLKMNPVPTEWEAGLTVSAKGLTFRADGFLRMRIDIRLKKEGVDPRDISAPISESIVIDIPAGTYTGEHLFASVRIPENTAHVAVFVEGKGYKGECYIEQPHLSAIGQNLLPSFNESVQDRTHMDWTAQYLSRKELPEFKVKLNGKVIYNGEIFERCHRHSEWEIALPSELLAEHNTLSYELISDYHDPLPYTFYEVGVIEQPASELSIIAVSEAAPSGGKARVLVRTERPNLRVEVVFESDALWGKREWVFHEKGLHGMLFDCGKLCENASFRLIYDGGEVRGTVKRIVHKTEDRVITGTGDMVYIRQDTDSMEEYLSWYISNGIGDFITIRPTYRWSGTKLLNKKVFEKFRRLMKELDMKYVLMADGRELPGLSSQPDEELLRGKGFLGIQAHERDGAQFYWGIRNAESLFDEQKYDLMRYAYEEAPKNTSSRYGSGCYYYNNGVMNVYADRKQFDDYQDEHKKSIDSLRAGRQETDTRHTGPACTFKYMAEAGYSWLGAETMYQTMEPIMGFLRGVVKEYGMPTFGVHHAVQWSSTPHESPARYRRYRLALYASYMQGAHDINTEEGLWHLEEYYEHHHRFGEACRNHLKQQQDFYKYVSTHTRSGSFYTPITFVHGRDDGITFFGKNKTWGHRDAPQTVAEDSWDLLTSVYPKAKPVSSAYVHGCPEDVPQGYHSGTPYGILDVIPAEGKAELWGEYGATVFMGYNRCEREDARKIADYVKQGGRVLLTDAHLTVTSSRREIIGGNLVIRKNALVMTDGAPRFVKDTVGGVELYVCSNPSAPDEVLAYTDSGRPLVCVYRIGKGELTVFHTKEYPAHTAIRALYEGEIKRLCQNTVDKEQIWAETGDDVEFTVYRQANGTRHVYFLAVDWYRSPDFARSAALRLGNVKYEFPVPFGVMLKCVCTKDVAVLSESEDGEVLSIMNDTVTVQGEGKVSFRIFKNGEQRVETVDFTGGGFRRITL